MRGYKVLVANLAAKRLLNHWFVLWPSLRLQCGCKNLRPEFAVANYHSLMNDFLLVDVISCLVCLGSKRHLSFREINLSKIVASGCMVLYVYHQSLSTPSFFFFLKKKKEQKLYFKLSFAKLLASYNVFKVWSSSRLIRAVFF